MNIVVKTKINSAFVKDFEESALKCAAQAIEALQTEVENAGVMPFDTGDMQNNRSFTDTRKKPGGVIDALIIVDAPQARRLYYHPEYNFQTVNNPRAGAEWFKDWSEGGAQQDFFKETFEKLMRKERGV